jgi:U3 small nucleolar RNA-associated protein 14
MPPRLSRSSVQTNSIRKPRNKTKSRYLDAFSIAAATTPDDRKVRKHRLADEDDEPQRKRPREASDLEAESDEEQPQNSTGNRRRNGENDDIEEDSDSEGHKWHVGIIDESDDSEIDSDEAFGDGDEDQFEDFVFRGSSTKKRVHRKQKRNIDLLEEESATDEDGGSDDESLGSDAVDLATMLDDDVTNDEPQAAQRPNHTNRQDNGSVDNFGTDSGEESDTEDTASISEDDMHDPTHQRKLQKLVSSLHPKETPSIDTQKQPLDLHEFSAPQESFSSQKLTLEDLLPTITDPKMKRGARLIKEGKGSSSGNGVPGKLEAPLPKRQQDKLNRIAANKQTKEQLKRWVETVKQNRRSEHLSFPLQYNDDAEPMGKTRLLPTSKPFNELESTIQSILQESGFSASAGSVEEKGLLEMEDQLLKNSMSREEREARQAELEKNKALLFKKEVLQKRRERERLFQEDIRAKRIAKIKSKMYRKIHRKEKDRLAQEERNELIAAGVDLSEEERELHDRRRAEERMGAKHRDSKWAKGMKQSGRAMWDEEVRVGVSDMARRSDELRRRMEGKDVAVEEGDTDLSSEMSDLDDEDLDDNTLATKSLQKQLSKLDKADDEDNQASRLASLPFMKRAEEARKKENDEAVRVIRKELAGQSQYESDSESEADMPGRREYGNSESKSNSDSAKPNRNEFEEPESEFEGCSDDAADPVKTDKQGFGSATAKQQSSRRQNDAVPETSALLSTNPWLSGKVKKPKGNAEASAVDNFNPWLAKSPQTGPENKTEVHHGDTAEKARNKRTVSKKNSTDLAVLSAPDADGWQTVSYSNGGNNQSSDEEVEADLHLPFAIKNQDLIRRGFAGDDAVADFEAEKKAAIEEDNEKVVDNTLPGWGVWVGEGLPKSKHTQNRKRVLVKQHGIKPESRKDAKLDRVIINEKRIRKNVKFMATSLPHQFESKQQYERSLRMPKGPEWTTKQTFQDATKPRVLIKQGIIRPPERPLA